MVFSRLIAVQRTQKNKRSAQPDAERALVRPAGDDIAIFAYVPGTTRAWLRRQVHLYGFAVESWSTRRPALLDGCGGG